MRASERLRLLLPLAARNGVRILAGTDAIATVAREVSLLVQHGLTPQDAPAAASTGAEDWLHPSAAGPDYIATYDANPRVDLATLESPLTIRPTRHVRLVPLHRLVAHVRTTSRELDRRLSRIGARSP